MGIVYEKYTCVQMVWIGTITITKHEKCFTFEMYNKFVVNIAFKWHASVAFFFHNHVRTPFLSLSLSIFAPQ